MEAKTVHEGAGNRTYNAAERQTVQYTVGSWDCLYVQPDTTLLPACIPFCCFAGDVWGSIPTITDS